LCSYVRNSSERGGGCDHLVELTAFHVSPLPWRPVF
jgi:hypothetical protein